MTLDALAAFTGRILLPLLGGTVSGKVSPRTFCVPDSSQVLWKDVAYRLTLGWRVAPTDVEVEEPVSVLVIDRFEVGGPALARPSQSAFIEEPLFTLTLFFGAGTVGPAADPASDSRSDFGFVNVTGEEVLQSSVGQGFGPRYGDADLIELKRRSGLSENSLREVLGNIRIYRLYGGLLQRRVYVKPSGSYSYLF